MIFDKFKNLIALLVKRYKLREKVKLSHSSKITINSEFEGMSRIYHNTFFHGKLGFGSYIGHNCSISAEVGRFTSIAPHVRCNDGIHPYKEPFVTTAPCFYSLNLDNGQNGGTFATKQIIKEYVQYDENKRIAIKIGSDCWIGEGAFIVGGIKIGDGCIILAHAVVTKDVPNYAIVGGVPAKIIDYRYDQETIDFLLKIKWWNNSLEWYKKNWELLNNIEELKKYYNNSNLIN